MARIPFLFVFLLLFYGVFVRRFFGPKPGGITLVGVFLGSCAELAGFEPQGGLDVHLRALPSAGRCDLARPGPDPSQGPKKASVPGSVRFSVRPLKMARFPGGKIFWRAWVRRQPPKMAPNGPKPPPNGVPVPIGGLRKKFKK